jgi:hypothetical protein
MPVAFRPEALTGLLRLSKKFIIRQTTVYYKAEKHFSTAFVMRSGQERPITVELPFGKPVLGK